MEESFEGVGPMGDSTDCGGACNRQWRGFMPRIHTLRDGLGGPGGPPSLSGDQTGITVD